MTIHIKKIEIQWINKPNYSKSCPLPSIKPDHSPQTILTYDFSHSCSDMRALRVKQLIKLIPPVKYTNTMQIEVNIFRNIKILWEIGTFHNKLPRRKVNDFMMYSVVYIWWLHFHFVCWVNRAMSSSFVNQEKVETYKRSMLQYRLNLIRHRILY